MHIAVIITTYNRPDALAAVLDGYLAQTDQDFEIIVADDGSTDVTRALVHSYISRSLVSISHVWQEDRGFRAAAIRNRALATTSAEYIIFTDGDCIPLPDFVAQHRRLATPRCFLAGNRILLNKEFTDTVIKQSLPVHRWGRIRWLVTWLTRKINRCSPFLRLPDGKFRDLWSDRWQGAKTCNLSAWRVDLLKVNGLDESYSGWGLEDSDLVIRLIRSGVKRRSAHFAAPLLHLWHSENDRSKLVENQKRLEAILYSQRIIALQGLTQYL
jgi:glycosyltransferase involved in cell wall biosynthesis